MKKDQWLFDNVLYNKLLRMISFENIYQQSMISYELEMTNFDCLIVDEMKGIFAKLSYSMQRMHQNLAVILNNV